MIKDEDEERSEEEGSEDDDSFETSFLDSEVSDINDLMKLDCIDEDNNSFNFPATDIFGDHFQKKSKE